MPRAVILIRIPHLLLSMVKSTSAQTINDSIALMRTMDRYCGVMQLLISYAPHQQYPKEDCTLVHTTHGCIVSMLTHQMVLMKGLQDAPDSPFDLIWKYKTDGSIFSSPAVAYGNVYVAAYKKVMPWNITGIVLYQ